MEMIKFNSQCICLEALRATGALAVNGSEWQMSTFKAALLRASARLVTLGGIDNVKGVLDTGHSIKWRN
jgi:hypothetical protein